MILGAMTGEDPNGNSKSTTAGSKSVGNTIPPPN